VVGTDQNFFEHYRFRGNEKIEIAWGLPDLSLWKVVIGSEVQKKLGYQLGDKVIIAHGVTRGEGIQKHDDKPFYVSGVMKPTGTAIDTSLYISLNSLEAIHMDWKDGAAPTKETAIKPEFVQEKNIRITNLTAFFLRTKSRIETLRLQREINQFQSEALLAIIPGVTLSELWKSLGIASNALQVISWMVIGVGLISMLIALLTGLNERRREMAILRSIGASPGQISFLLVLESTALTLIGLVLGLVIELSGFFILQGWIQDQFGLYLVGDVLSSREMIYLALTLILGILIGFIPAMKASRTALKDGLSVKI
jgi:putative ABC transport system permease protein